MLHAVIIDDESNGLKSLELLIKKFSPEVKVIATSTKAIEGVKLINDYRPDIVFLDIYMPNLNGFELLEKLEFRNFHLIFTTAHKEYAIKAIKEQAIDYLLKPIGSEDLNIAVEKVKRKIKEHQLPNDVYKLLSGLQETQNIKIPIPGKNGIDLVHHNEIIHIEASSNNCVVTIQNKDSALVSKSLKDYEELLCKQEMPFIRIHNSFIINVNYATTYLKEDGGVVVMKDKKSIPISKNKKDEFLKLINFRQD